MHIRKISKNVLFGQLKIYADAFNSYYKRKEANQLEKYYIYMFNLVESASPLAYADKKVQEKCTNLLMCAQRKMAEFGIQLDGKYLSIRKMKTEAEIIKITKEYLRQIKLMRKRLKNGNNTVYEDCQKLVEEIEAFIKTDEGVYAVYIRIGFLGLNLQEQLNKLKAEMSA